MPLAEGDKGNPRRSASVLWELTSSLTAPLASQLIFIKLNIRAVLCKGRNIKQKVQEGGSRGADLPPGEALATALAAMGHPMQHRRQRIRSKVLALGIEFRLHVQVCLQR